jgi:hypothetical protein
MHGLVEPSVYLTSQTFVSFAPSSGSRAAALSPHNYPSHIKGAHPISLHTDRLCFSLEISKQRGLFVSIMLSGPTTL